MNAAERVMGRESATARRSLVLNRPSRHGWGPTPRRVVRVGVVREIDGTMTATTHGADGGRVVELERARVERVEFTGRMPVVVLADGTTWQLESTGCSCNVPGPLKSFSPVRDA